MNISRRYLSYDIIGRRHKRRGIRNRDRDDMLEMVSMLAIVSLVCNNLVVVMVDWDRHSLNDSYLSDDSCHNVGRVAFSIQNGHG